MKHFIAIAAVLITGAASAQTITRKAVFTKGQQIESNSTMKMVMTMEMMGQSMEMVNTYKFTSKIGVTDATPVESKLSNTLTHVVVDMQAGPQSMSYDSDKKEDANSQLGQAFSDKINKTTNITVDKAGKITASDATETIDEADIMASMSGGMGESMTKIGASVEIIANLPEKTLKVGDTWVDSLTEQKTNSKVVLNYRVDSIQGNVAKVNFGGTVSRNGEIAQGGMTMNMDFKGLLKGDLTMDVATGQLKNKKTNIDGDGKLEMAGQEIPFKIKIDSDTNLDRK